MSITTGASAGSRGRGKGTKLALEGSWLARHVEGTWEMSRDRLLPGPPSSCILSWRAAHSSPQPRWPRHGCCRPGASPGPHTWLPCSQRPTLMRKNSHSYRIPRMRYVQATPVYHSGYPWVSLRLHSSFSLHVSPAQHRDDFRPCPASPHPTLQSQ